MTGEKYQQMGDFFRKTKLRSHLLTVVSKWFPFINIVVYASLLEWLFLTKSEELLRCIAVPAVTFLVVTLMRVLINRQRPYDRFSYTPFFPVKKGKGKSFPSRHAASAVIIALAVLSVHSLLGVVMLVIAYLIAASRVVTGQHAPVDVVCAVLLSHIFGFIGFVLL